jgi:tellurite resistance protein TerC
MTRRPTSTAASSWRVARKVAVAALGVSVLAFGVMLIVLPGPSILVIPLGLAILATEFLWARKLLGPTRKLLGWLRVRAARIFCRLSRPARPKAVP